MSGARPPVAAPLQLRADDVPGSFRRIEAELARLPRQGGRPVFDGIQLRAPDGSLWLLRVNNAGALVTSQVPP